MSTYFDGTPIMTILRGTLSVFKNTTNNDVKLGSRERRFSRGWGWPVNEWSYWRRITYGLLGQLGCGRSSCTFLAVEFSHHTVDGEKIRGQFFNSCFEGLYFFLLLRKRTVDTVERIGGSCTCLNATFERLAQPQCIQVLQRPSQNTASCPQDLEDGSSTTSSHTGQMHFSVCRTFGRRLANGTGRSTLHTRQGFRLHLPHFQI